MENEFKVICKNCKSEMTSKYPDVLPKVLDFGSCFNCTPTELFDKENDITDIRINLGREFDKITKAKRLEYININIHPHIVNYIELYNKLKPESYEPQDVPELIVPKENWPSDTNEWNKLALETNKPKYINEDDQKIVLELCTKEEADAKFAKLQRKQLLKTVYVIIGLGLLLFIIW